MYVKRGSLKKVQKQNYVYISKTNAGDRVKWKYRTRMVDFKWLREKTKENNKKKIYLDKYLVDYIMYKLVIYSVHFRIASDVQFHLKYHCNMCFKFKKERENRETLQIIKFLIYINKTIMYCMEFGQLFYLHVVCLDRHAYACNSDRPYTAKTF